MAPDENEFATHAMDIMELLESLKSGRDIKVGFRGMALVVM